MQKSTAFTAIGSASSVARRWLHQAAATAALGIAVAAPVHAIPISYAFTGTVISNNKNPFGITDGPGAAVSGVFTYESTVPDQIPLDASLGAYFQNPPGVQASIRFASGATVANNGSFRINVNNNFLGFDRFDVQEVTGGALVNDVVQPDANFFAVALFDPTQTAFSSDLLPTSVDLTRFSQAAGNINTFSLTGDIFYNVTSLSRIPEPATAVLLALALVLMQGWLVRSRLLPSGTRSR